MRTHALHALPQPRTRTAILAGPLVPRVALHTFLVVWVAAWIGLGIWTGYEVNNLRSLSDTVVKSGSAMRTTERAKFGSRSWGIARSSVGANDSGSSMPGCSPRSPNLSTR